MTLKSYRAKIRLPNKLTKGGLKMLKPFNDQRFVDLVIKDATPSFKKKLHRNYRICTITNYGTDRYINLRLPVEIQQKILSAYSQGKQVRIFA